MVVCIDDFVADFNNLMFIASLQTPWLFVEYKSRLICIVDTDIYLANNNPCKSL